MRRQSKTVGVDVGIETFGTCSDGEKMKRVYPKLLKEAEKKLRRRNAPLKAKGRKKIVRRPARHLGKTAPQGEAPTQRLPSQDLSTIGERKPSADFETLKIKA